MPRFRLSGPAWQAKYEGDLPAGHLDRPAADLQEVPARWPARSGADAFAHGATGKGNDQCRFQLAAEALAPDVQVIAPWRIEAFREQFPGRSEMIAYCEQKNIPVKASVAKPYSSDENCLHISYEAGQAGRPDGQRRRTGRVRHDRLAAGRHRTRWRA